MCWICGTGELKWARVRGPALLRPTPADSRYVSFTVQNNPSSPSRIIPVVESATRRFIDDARYQQDIRYLKLWIIYARQVERREEVWPFLESRDVGTRHAAFYEEWALVLEGLGR